MFSHRGLPVYHHFTGFGSERRLFRGGSGATSGRSTPRLKARERAGGVSRTRFCPGARFSCFRHRGPRRGGRPLGSGLLRCFAPEAPVINAGTTLARRVTGGVSGAMEDCGYLQAEQGGDIVGLEQLASLPSPRGERQRLFDPGNQACLVHRAQTEQQFRLMVEFARRSRRARLPRACTSRRGPGNCRRSEYRTGMETVRPAVGIVAPSRPSTAAHAAIRPASRCRRRNPLYSEPYQSDRTASDHHIREVSL